MKKIAIITGASSGMGKEFVKYIDNHIKYVDELWIIARRKDRLDEIKNKTTKSCRVICADITDKRFKDEFLEILKDEKPEIKLLINSAGYGIYGLAYSESVDIETGMIDINCIALTKMTLLCIPYMKKNSHIINIASSAAFLPQPKFSIYAASKAYVLNFSRALRYELKSDKIYVTTVCPGPVATDFFAIAEKGSKKPKWKELFMAKPEKVVKKAMKDSINNKEISIYGISMKLFYILTKIVPHRIILKIYSIF